MDEVSEKMEQYLETIHGLTKAQGYARVKDISYELGISAPSVTEMIQKLKKKGLVSYESYHPVRLTDEGDELARCLESRHEILEELFKTIDVCEKTAQEDACRIEHQISSETVEKLGKLLDYLKQNRICEKNPLNPVNHNQHPESTKP